MRSRKQKEKKVLEIKNDLENSQVMILTDYRGLSVAKMNQLRRILEADGIRYKVVKNTLTRLAAHQAGLEELDVYMEGPVAIAYGYDDPVTPVKLLVKFAKEHDELEIKGGVLEKQVMDESQIRRLADLPPKEVLLARVAGAFQAPLAGMANALQGNLRNLVYVLNAVKEQKESA